MTGHQSRDKLYLLKKKLKKKIEEVQVFINGSETEKQFCKLYAPYWSFFFW